jgi:MFS transporter, YNFM family, putative membrane transport protein
MASAFTLTLAYLGEHYSAADSASAFAAYITGNVASNLVGRLISAAVADHFGLAANFYFFASLNLIGAVLVYFAVEKTPCMQCVTPAMSSHFQAWIMHLKNPSLRASFAIGFCILFAFIGTFTYVNFVLVQPPLGVGAMTLGFIYFVFLPSIATTPLAGRAVRSFGTRPTFWSALLVAGIGLPLLIVPNLSAVLVGMVLVGVGTFFAQACATGFVGRAALSDRGSASGLYLASYFFGGLVGSAVLGLIFDMFGWAACVAGIAVSCSSLPCLPFSCTRQWRPSRSLADHRRHFYSAASLCGRSSDWLPALSGSTSAAGSAPGCGSCRMTPSSGSNSPSQACISSARMVSA